MSGCERPPGGGGERGRPPENSKPQARGLSHQCYFNQGEQAARQGPPGSSGPLRPAVLCTRTNLNEGEKLAFRGWGGPERGRDPGRPGGARPGFNGTRPVGGAVSPHWRVSYRLILGVPLRPSG